MTVAIGGKRGRHRFLCVGYTGSERELYGQRQCGVPRARRTMMRHDFSLRAMDERATVEVGADRNYGKILKNRTDLLLRNIVFERGFAGSWPAAAGSPA